MHGRLILICTFPKNKYILVNVFRLTVKLGDKESFDKEQVVFKEPFLVIDS